MIFKYGKKEIDYLKSRDKRLGEVIDQIGRIRWEVEPDLFGAVVQNIVAQQISGSAAASILERLWEKLDGVTPETVKRFEEYKKAAVAGPASLKRFRGTY